MAELVFNVDNTALETVKALQIKANFDEMEKALAEVVEPYKNLIVSEDGIAQAKTDRAKLRKLSTSIDDRRKLVKKIYSQPLVIFEDNCKRLTSICAQGIDNLDGQVKEYEAKAKAQKIYELTQYFDNLPKRNPQFMQFEACVNPKWTNVTYPAEQAQTEIENYVMKVDNDIDAIKALDSKYESMLLDEYKKTGDISSVLLLKKRAEDAEREAERKAAEAEESRRRAEEERLRVEAEKERMQEQKKAEQTPVHEVEHAKEPARFAKVYMVVCRSPEQEEALINFCKNREMEFVWKGDI